MRSATASHCFGTHGPGTYSQGTLTLTNSTISGNSADVGGGIYIEIDSRAEVTNSTITQNLAGLAGGDIANAAGPTLMLRNALVAQNRTAFFPDIASITPPVARFSLIGDGEGSGLEGQHGVNGNQVGTPEAPIDPRLGPLQFNGGPTKTHALLLGSPAINRSTLEGCPATDQRGVRRPQGLTCDIGSFERVRQSKPGG